MREGLVDADRVGHGARPKSGVFLRQEHDGVAFLPVLELWGD